MAKKETYTPPKKKVETPVEKISVNVALLNVRSTPEVSNNIVDMVKKGETFELLEKKEVNNTAWGKISLGWIMLQYTI